jgi:hypothetical protein
LLTAAASCRRSPPRARFHRSPGPASAQWRRWRPFDCAALVNSDRTAARRSLTQTADYLDPICDAETGNPSDLAVHLTRRVRGVPLRASVLAYGTDAYAAETVLRFCFVNPPTTREDVDLVLADLE